MSLGDWCAEEGSCERGGGVFGGGVLERREGEGKRDGERELKRGAVL